MPGGTSVSKRNFSITVHTQTADGNLQYNPAAPQEFSDLLTDFEVVLSRIGGTFSVVADRARIGDGDEDFITLGFRARWEAFSPVADLRPPSEPPEAPEEPQAPPTHPEPDPEPDDGLFDEPDADAEDANLDEVAEDFELDAATAGA